MTQSTLEQLTQVIKSNLAYISLCFASWTTQYIGNLDYLEAIGSALSVWLSVVISIMVVIKMIVEFIKSKLPKRK